MKCTINLQDKYVIKDNLLILHLTDRCNNRCKFCMVDEIHGLFSFPYEAALRLIDKLPVQAKVDLFGGEPTLYPRFFELLQYIKAQNLKCSIATNGRLFSKQDFIDKVVAITGKALYVRTSLYGLTAEVHDRLTGVIHSYDELMLGLDQIVAAQMSCQVNIVLTKLNLSDLREITRLVINKGVKKIKFGLIVDAQACLDLVPTLAEIRPQLLESIQLAVRNGLTVTIEKAPLCLVPEYMNEFSGERELGQWPRCFDDAGECGYCIVRKWCDGLDPGYLQVFGSVGISGIKKVSSEVLAPFPEDSGDAYISFLKFNLFAMPQNAIQQEKCESIMLGLMEQAKQKYARIAFVPAQLQEMNVLTNPAAADRKPGASISVKI